MTSGASTKSNLLTYSYRADGKLSTESFGYGPQTPFRFTYTAGGRPLSMADPYTGTTITNVEAPYNTGHTYTLVARSETYDSYGRPASLTMPMNGQYTSFGYDPEETRDVADRFRRAWIDGFELRSEDGGDRLQRARRNDQPELPSAGRERPRLDVAAFQTCERQWSDGAGVPDEPSLPAHRHVDPLSGWVSALTQATSTVNYSRDALGRQTGAVAITPSAAGSMTRSTMRGIVVSHGLGILHEPQPRALMRQQLQRRRNVLWLADLLVGYDQSASLGGRRDTALARDERAFHQQCDRR